MTGVSEGVPVSATDNYTPTTNRVRSIYGTYWSSVNPGEADQESFGAEFDRWLAAERAKARQDAEKVILEAWQVIDHNCQAYKILSAALRSEEVQ